METRRSFPGPRAALGLYALLAIALTWPLAWHLTDRLPAGDNDLWQSYWNFWWWRTALFERGQLPYSTDLLYQPGPVSLAFHTHSEANVIPTLPIQLALGVPAAFNTALLLSYVLCGWGGYFLAREIVGENRSALVAGLVLMFHPQRVEQSLEHLNLVSFQAMPFFLVFFLRLLRTGGWKNGLAAGLLYALNALYSWHNGLLVLPFALVLFAQALWRGERNGGRPRPRISLDAALAGCIALACMLPFAWPMIREILAGETYFQKPPINRAIDPLFLLVPSESHPLWGRLFSGLYERLRGYAAAGFTCYAGSIALGLWLAGGWWSRMRSPWKLWTFFFCLAIVLAMGDSLASSGHDSGIWLPFAGLRSVPILSTIRIPNRFIVPAMLSLSVLAAIGARELARRADARRPGAGRWANVGLLVLIALDFLAVPFPLRELPRPAWLEAVIEAPDGLLLDVPGGHRARGAEDMYFQTIHHRPMVGGYTSCIPPGIEHRVASLPYLQLVFEGRPKMSAGQNVDVGSGLKQALEALPVRVVVVHLDRKRESLEEKARLAAGTPRARLFNPERGTSAAVIDESRTALRGLWGDPIFADAEAEVFVRR